MASVVHASAPFVGFNISNGNQIWMRVRWATDPGALASPPTVPRTAANYSETPPVFISTNPTPDNPVLLAIDPVFWNTIRMATRTLYTAVEWHPASSTAWQSSGNFQFIINHDPVASAGPDQLVILDAAGKLTDDISLDASASDDQDLHAAVNADPGPLKYRWWPATIPPSVPPNDPVWNGMYGVASQNTATPQLLSAGTAIPQTDRGEYRFQLYVDDNDRMTVGRDRSQLGVGSAVTRVVIAADNPGLAILSPTQKAPAFDNLETEVKLDIRVYYQIGDTVAADAAYADGWILRCRITQEKPAPEFMLLSELPGTVVYEASITSDDRTGFFAWDGTLSATSAPAATGCGSFTITLELLDSNGDPTGVAGAVAREKNAIVIDLFEWLLPVKTAWSQTAQTGSFMESGHAGKYHTRLHTGLDMVSRVEQHPTLIAARSGFWRGMLAGAHDITLEHAAPDSTEYLHGDNIAAFAAGDLVLQGERLGDMSNLGVQHAGVHSGGVHLHFEYYEDYTASGGDLTIVNPLAIVKLRDAVHPTIDDVRLRVSPGGAHPAQLTLAKTGISGLADLIIRCRDRAHPDQFSSSGAENGPYGVVVEEVNGIATWPSIAFQSMTKRTTCEQFYEVSGIKYPGMPLHFDPIHEFLPYLRLDTSIYAGTTSPLQLNVTVTDWYGQKSAPHPVVIGPSVRVKTPVPSPAMSAAAPQPFQVTLTINNSCAGLADISDDTFTIALLNARSGWTIASGASSGVVHTGQSVDVVVKIDPHGVAVPGDNTFALSITSGIVTHVGVQLPLNAIAS